MQGQRFDVGFIDGYEKIKKESKGLIHCARGILKSGDNPLESIQLVGFPSILG